VQAAVLHVDSAKARVFLSVRRTTNNPLLETLDSLVAGSAAATAGNDGGPGAVDQRPRLGDMPEALRFCDLLRQRPGVAAAEPGVRLQSRAAAQELEVYLSTKSASSGTEAPSDVGAAESFSLVLRKGQSVQEVAVTAALSRDEMRELATACVTEVAQEIASVS
jgi:hypothetical protein